MIPPICRKFNLLHSTKTREEIQGLVLLHWRDTTYWTDGGDKHLIRFEVFSGDWQLLSHGTCRMVITYAWPCGLEEPSPEDETWRTIFARVWELARELDQ